MDEACSDQKSSHFNGAEVQDIFRAYGETYRQKHKLPLHVLKTMSAIEKCRTSALGGHVEVCKDCGHIRNSYNSCKNRHCPKCQSIEKERWIESQKESLLNVRYFHAVFTIPDTLNTVTFQNQKVVYNILFRAVAETLTELCADKKHLGASVGFTSILHTWGQNLMHHPHIHCIIPAGGINSLGNWVNSRKKFFIPVKVLSRKFRGKFLFYLNQAFTEKQLLFFNATLALSEKKDFNKFLTLHYKKEWVVYCKPPFKNAGCVIEYLGRYTHRTAISNNRIISMSNGKVRFKWRDYNDNSKWKIMIVPGEEFIRRFLIHILPPGFQKIRHYGFLGNRNKAKKLLICKQLTNTPINDYQKISTAELIQKITGIDISKCPVCGSANITRYNEYEKSPPSNVKAS